MPLEFSSSFTQDSRKSRVSSPDTFFHLMHSVDVDHAVDLINDGIGDFAPPEIYGRKAIIKNATSSFASPEGLANNDIVMWNGTNWEIYMDVSNPEMNNSIVYDKRTQKFYQYTPSSGWVAIVAGDINGGTY